MKRMPDRRRRWPAAGLALLLLGAGGCTRRGEAVKTDEAALMVSPADVACAAPHRLESGISFTGELQPQQVTSVTARFDCDIARVLVREGQAVRRGQSLALFKPRDVQDLARSAEADWLAAQAGLAAARSAERRARRLLEAGAAAPSELEAAQAALAAAEARQSLAEAGRNRTREDSEKLVVPSPIGGRVGRILVHDGARPALGDPLLTIVNTDTLELAATIPSEALGRVRVGTPIRFTTDAFPGETFVGQVDRVGATTEPGTRQIMVYTRIPNPGQRLVGGLFAGGRIIDAGRDDALAAPLAVLRGEGGQSVVYRLRRGRAERVVVKTGLVDEAAGLTELIGPVAAGDSLLMGVLPGIKDGVPVRVLAGDPAAAPGGTGAAATPPPAPGK